MIESAHLLTLTCQRCGHVWIRRIEKLPIRCPKCQSVKWQSPKLETQK